MISTLPNSLDTLEADIAFDVMAEIKKSPFSKIAQKSKEEFEAEFKKNLEAFVCPVTNLKFK